MNAPGPARVSAQGIYRLVRDSGWHIERTRRMKGMSLRITSPDHPGELAGAFGRYGTIAGDMDGELAAWHALARDWNDGDFWRDEPD